MIKELKDIIPRRTLAEVMELFHNGELVGPMILTNRDYHAAPALSKSALDNIDVSPKYYQYKLKNPDDMKPNLIIGSARHNKLMNDEPFDSLFYITKTQPQKPERDELGREPLSQKNLELVEEMQKAWSEDALASRLIGEDCLCETSFFWTDQETGILCKSKIDLWWPLKGLAGDFKTTTDCGDNFMFSIEEYRYDVQAAFALEGIRCAFEQWGVNIGGHHPTKFVFMAQEKEPPYDIGFHELGPLSLVSGEIGFRENLNTYAECIRTGVWNGKRPSFKETEVRTTKMRVVKE